MKLPLLLSTSTALFTACAAAAPVLDDIKPLTPMLHGRHEMGGMNDMSSHHNGDDHQTDVPADTEQPSAVYVTDAAAKSTSAFPWSTASPMHHGMPILDMPNLEPQQRRFWEAYNTTTFFNTPSPTKAFLWIHVFATVAAWFFIYPVSLVFAAEKSSYHLPIQTLQYATVVVSLVSLAIYSTAAPDLYPNNAYSKMSVALFIVTTVHWLALCIKFLSAWATGSGDAVQAPGYMLAQLHPNELRRSHDSGHGGSHNGSTTDEEEEDIDFEEMGDYSDEQSSESTLVRNQFSAASSSKYGGDAMNERIIGRLMKFKVIEKAVVHGGKISTIVFATLNRPLFAFGFGYLLTGIATGFCMGKGSNVFGLLAHFIKGGIFFLMGLVELSRYLGCWADLGMAWNVRPGSEYDPSNNIGNATHRKYVVHEEPKTILGRLANFKVPSMEFIECFLVFLYGSLNIFMEHLGNTDGVWSAKDLQHESIAFMYLGGGLCGVLAEAPPVRRLLRKAVHSNNAHADPFVVTDAYNFNPFPAFIVFWTGVLMSQHHQALPLATTIHMQWGYLFCVGALFRLCTYGLILVGKPHSTEPSRPFTEIITCFCLICGGMVFMESQSETVLAMIYRGLDGMFTLNVSVCFTALIMSWEYIVVMLKGVARRV